MSIQLINIMSSLIYEDVESHIEILMMTMHQLFAAVIEILTGLEDNYHL